MSWEKYLALSVKRRWVMHDELMDMIPASDAPPPPPGEPGEDAPEPQPSAGMRPKRLRK